MANAPTLRPSQNGHYLVEAQGNPFFWLGDTAWPLFVHYSREEAETYLVDRAQRGFNVVQTIFALGTSNNISAFEGTAPSPNPVGARPWDNTPAEPNPRFFDYAAELMERANQLGLYICVAPMWGYGVTNLHLFDEQNAYTYGCWLGQRFRDQPNIIWMNGCDREPIGYEGIYSALAEGLRRGDEGSHLITYHPSGSRSSSYFWQSAAWLDFHMIQTWTRWYHIYQMVAADYGLTPTRPVILAEGAYEDGPEYPTRPITPLLVRRQAWWAWMAGGFFTYGQNEMWRMEKGWLDTRNSLGAQHMTVFKQIATSRQWWDMIPDQSVFTYGESSGRTLNTAMRNSSRTCIMVYLSEQTHFVLEMNRIATAQARATWVNPQTGETKPGGMYRTGNLIPGNTFPERISQAFTTPDFWEDAVLILDAD